MTIDNIYMTPILQQIIIEIMQLNEDVMNVIYDHNCKVVDLELSPNNNVDLIIEGYENNLSRVVSIVMQDDDGIDLYRLPKQNNKNSINIKIKLNDQSN